MIEVDHLSRFYGPLPALQDVSFTAYRGEIVGFLGPNGAGKTTTMRILTGYMPPSAGRATVAGHDVVEDSMAARAATGYLPESTPLYTDMTVLGYLSFMARLRGVKDVSAAVERVMARTAVDHRADDLIGQLSKGYRQRVGIAQALVHNPPVLILDEPTIGLDPRQIREVRGLIRELSGDHTVLLSTHILPEAQQVCDRVLIIHRGQLVAEDAPDALTAALSGGEQARVAVPDDLDAATVAAALQAVGGVTEVAAQGAGVYLVTAVPGSNPRPQLAETVVGRGWPLLELTRVGLTLEDIFLQLTDEDAEHAGELEGQDEERPENTDAAVGDAGDEEARDG
jgi:ABC-2 type transport system ATP-binding protein